MALTRSRNSQINGSLPLPLWWCFLRINLSIRLISRSSCWFCFLRRNFRNLYKWQMPTRFVKRSAIVRECWRYDGRVLQARWGKNQKTNNFGQNALFLVFLPFIAESFFDAKLCQKVLKSLLSWNFNWAFFLKILLKN